jgi:hypothetical protein
MISRDEAQKGPIKSKPQKSDGGLMAYFVKHYATVSAMGCSATPVFIATDDNMKVDDIDVYAVPGLGNGTDVGCEGLLVFLKTRVPTVPFSIWFIKEVLVTFVTDIRSAAGGCLDGKLAWFQLDGEAEQIAPYQLKDVQTLLKDNNIVVGKPPGGTTSWTQPLDLGNYFKARKTALKNIKDSDAARFKLLVGAIRGVAAAHNEKFAVASSSSSSSATPNKSGMTAAHITSLSYGLVCIHLAMQKTINADTISKSFELVGVCLLNSNVIFGNCHGKLTPNALLRFNSNLNKLKSLMLAQGELFEEDFNRAGIPPGTKVRDDLVLNQRRSVLLSSTEVIKREENKKRSAA